MSKFVIALFAVAQIFLISSPVDALDITFAIPNASSESLTYGVRVLANEIERLSGSSVEVKVVPDAIELRDGLASGAYQFAALSPQTLGEWNKDLVTLSLPFVFNDVSSLKDFLWSNVAADLFKGLLNYGVLGLTYWPAPSDAIFSKEPLQSKDSFNGISVLVPSGGLNGLSLASLGVKPVYESIPQTEGSYSEAIALRGIDALQVAPEAALEGNLSRLTPYVTSVGFYSSGHVIAANVGFWESLDDPARRAYVLALSVATNSLFASLQSKEKTIKERLTSAGFTFTATPQGKLDEFVAQANSAWVGFGIEEKVVRAARGTRGGGDSCSIDQCRCIDRTCSKDCCATSY